jgi:hypothetical protein
VKVDKLTGTDGFVIVDLDDATTSVGVVRLAPKVLRDGAELLARAVTYTFAAFGVRGHGGASAAVNAKPESRDDAVAAFVDEVRERAASGALRLSPGVGLSPEDLAPLGWAPPDPALTAEGALAAARVAGLDPLDLFALTDTVKQVSEGHDLTLVEGAGGLLVPLGLRPSGQAWTIADMAVALGAPAIVVTRAGLGTLNHTALTLEALERRGIEAGVVIGAWPQRPELVHFTNLVDMPGQLRGLLPDGAGAMEPGVFQRSAPGWLTGDLHGTCDDPRELATGEEE